MIRSFQCQWVEDLHHGVDSMMSREVPIELHAKIHRIFDTLNIITSIEAIKIPGVDNIDKFAGGAWSLRISPEWRIIFKWFEGDIYNLDLIRE